MSRLAPRRISPENLKLTKTNVGSINESVANHINGTDADQRNYMYGIAPVVIEDESS